MKITCEADAGPFEGRHNFDGTNWQLVSMLDPIYRLWRMTDGFLVGRNGWFMPDGALSSILSGGHVGARTSVAHYYEVISRDESDGLLDVKLRYLGTRPTMSNGSSSVRFSGSPPRL
ncbi:MAG: hypothetical protein HY000_30390 [Planctomycetes bacterium]|nr:hypothetical protein [Planctomycetota bacterium]